MNMTKYNLIFLFLIMTCAALLRLVALGVNPPALTWDEAAWGYNAYSLGVDGRDEFGKFLPLQYIESFGDFKPPVYAYLDILPIKIFGLSEFATRFPSALAGIVAVFFTYFLVLRLFPNNKYREWYALTSSALLAISPWHIMLSRAAFEANVATTFIIIAVWALLAGIQGKKWLLLVSAVCFIVPFYTFNTPRVFLPLFILFLVPILWKQLWRQKKWTIISAIVGIALLLPLIPFLLSPQASVRFQEVNIFSDPQIVKTSNQEIANDGHSLLGKFLHNRRFLYAHAFLQHYFDNLNPEFLFFEGDINPKFSIRSAGELYIWCLPFFYLGILLIFRKREGYWYLLPIWFVLGIIPAATARETPHALRTEVILPTVQIFIAYGLVTTLLFLKNKMTQNRWWYVPLLVLVIMILFEFVKFTHTLFAHYPFEYSQEWQYGYKQSIAFVKAHESEYDQVNISDVLGRPYIYYLFYLQVDPAVFRQDVTIRHDAFGFVHVDRFGKYYFGEHVDQLAGKDKRNLFIAPANQVPTTAHVLKSFYDLNNKPVFTAYAIY